jgi:Protein of unknown function (DUF1570)
MSLRPTQSSCASMSRRAWLLSALAGGASASTWDDEEDLVRAIRTRGTKAGLGAFGVSRSDHFSAIGDAPENFRRETLDVCESVAKSYQAHFRPKGLNVSPPKQHLILVVLASRKSYASFGGEDPGPAVGGHYDQDENYLVTFDFRQSGRAAAVAPARINTRTLVHEATHLLTFNTGLLDRHGDVPRCVSEGLGTYAETWRPRGRGDYGQINSEWLKVFVPNRRKIKDWLPIARLLTDDGLFERKEALNIAYAESWTVVYTLLSSNPGPPKLRRYLDMIQLRRDPADRLKDAEKAFGDLDELDSEVGRNASRLIRRL